MTTSRIPHLDGPDVFIHSEGQQRKGRPHTGSQPSYVDPGAYQPPARMVRQRDTDEASAASATPLTFVSIASLFLVDYSVTRRVRSTRRTRGFRV